MFVPIHFGYEFSWVRILPGTKSPDTILSHRPIRLRSSKHLGSFSGLSVSCPQGMFLYSVCFKYLEWNHVKNCTIHDTTSQRGNSNLKCKFKLYAAFRLDCNWCQIYFLFQITFLKLCIPVTTLCISADFPCVLSTTTKRFGKYINTNLLSQKEQELILYCSVSLYSQNVDIHIYKNTSVMH